MKKIFILCLTVYAYIYLSKQGMLPSINELKSHVNQFLSEQQSDSPEKSTRQHIATKQAEAAAIPTTYNKKYAPVKIQTYWVTIKNGKLVVTGKPTEYGQYYHAEGVILYIEEPRANKKTTIKVPFSNGTIHYEFPLAYNVGDVVLNLDEYYKGKANDPNKVLGYAKYHLTDGDPYLQPSFMVQSDNPTLKVLAHNITDGLSSDEDKSRAIFKWVAKNVAYNVSLVDSKHPPIYSALQTYKTPIVLCSGYADLSAALHRAVGIDAKVDYGENHAWNEIKLNGRWQTEDPTYGSGFINAGTMKFVHYYNSAYFTKSDKHKEGEYHW